MKRQDTLKEIVQKKKERIEIAKQALPEEELKKRIDGLAPRRQFIESIKKPHTISLIAEIKKASPSAGLIRQNFNLQEIVTSFEAAGVQAISVLTEEDYFQGNISFINEVKNLSSVPILRKDFILEPYQVYESAVFGADAILLIADLLTRDQLKDFMQLAGSLGLDCLLEAHTEKELKKILNLGVPLIGINNRDLHTLEVDSKNTEKLFPLIPKDKTVVVESGIKTPQDILFLKILGVNAVLVGEIIMRAEDIKAGIEELRGW